MHVCMHLHRWHIYVHAMYVYTHINRKFVWEYRANRCEQVPWLWPSHSIPENQQPICIVPWKHNIFDYWNCRDWQDPRTWEWWIWHKDHKIGAYPKPKYFSGKVTSFASSRTELIKWPFIIWNITKCYSPSCENMRIEMFSLKLVT